MSDTRKSTKLKPGVKEALNDLKKKLHLSSESETIGYLLAVYEQRIDKITMQEHGLALTRSKELNNQ